MDSEILKDTLNEFFKMVHNEDGMEELVRIHNSFYSYSQSMLPTDGKDWSDTTPDGSLKRKGPTRAAANRK